MELRVQQREDDGRNYVAEFVEFVRPQVKTQEQLESRFDALACEFAMKNKGQYNPNRKTMDFEAIVVDIYDA